MINIISSQDKSSPAKLILTQCATYAIKNNGIVKMNMGNDSASLSVGDNKIFDIPLKWYPKIINICKLAIGRLPQYNKSIISEKLFFK